MQDEATLMMVTYNRLDLTKKTLESLSNNTIYKPINLIIVDNCSTDGTVEYLKGLKPKFCSKFIFEANEENRGIARGRNKALRIADELKTKWYCTVDNDVEVPFGWLTEAIEVLKQNRSYGSIGVNMEGKKYPEVTLKGKKIQNKPAGNLGTACMVFPKSTHKMLGFFNSVDYSPFYGLEDSDFGMRMRAAGFKLGYIEKMGKHIGDDDNDEGEYRKFKTYEHDRNVGIFKRNCSLYYSKNKPLYFKCRE